jgi:hypothetical protein
MTGRALKESAIAAAVARGLSPEDTEAVGEVVGSIKVGRDRLVSPDANPLDAAANEDPQP